MNKPLPMMQPHWSRHRWFGFVLLLSLVIAGIVLAKNWNEAHEKGISTRDLILAVLGLLGFLILWMSTLVWSYRDAESRGKSGALIAFLVGVISWPWGVLIWLAARPSQRILRVAPYEEDIDCPECGMKIKAGWTACRNCCHQNQEVIR